MHAPDPAELAEQSLTEQPLTEQRLTGGVIASAVRVGQTVRRSPSTATPAVHELLEFLHRRGFTRVPQLLGVDGKGREVLSFVPGRAGHPPITPDIASDDALVSAARTIRAFHDLSVDLLAAGWSGWNPAAADPSGEQEVICHNDLAPFNIVFQTTRVAALIDWDLAAPGRRVWDLGYAAWRLVPLHRPAYTARLGWPPLDRARRLRLFVDAYGLEPDDRAALLGLVDARIRHTIAGMRRLVEAGRLAALPASDPRAEAGDLDYLAEHAEQWHAATTAGS